VFTFQQDDRCSSTPCQKDNRDTQKNPATVCQISGHPTVDLNADDYKIWAVTEQRIYQMKIYDVSELRQHQLNVWQSIEQCTIDAPTVHLRA